MAVMRPTFTLLHTITNNLLENFCTLLGMGGGWEEEAREEGSHHMWGSALVCFRLYSTELCISEASPSLMNVEYTVDRM